MLYEEGVQDFTIVRKMIDRAVLVGRGGGAEGAGFGGVGGAEGEAVPVGSEAVVLLLGGFEVGDETGVVVHCGYGGGGNMVAGIDIALPVGAHNDAAFSVLVTSSEYGILELRGNLNKCKRSGPAEGGMAGWVGAVVAKIVIVKLSPNLLVGTGKRTDAHIGFLGVCGALMGGFSNVEHKAVDGRSCLRINL